MAMDGDGTSSGEGEGSHAAEPGANAQDVADDEVRRHTNVDQPDDTSILVVDLSESEPPEPTAPSRLSAAPLPGRWRSRRRAVLLIGIMILAVMGIAAWFLLTGDDEGLGDPQEARLPEQAHPDQVQRYLAGPGRPLIELLVISEASTADGTPGEDHCRDLVSDDLPAIGTPPALVALAADIPDDATADMASNFLAAWIGMLAHCGQGDEVDLEPLLFAETIFRRRVDEVLE